MSDPAFFGYGSLVNLATHAYTNPQPAQLHGWRRVWRHTHLRPLAFLSVEPAPDATIAGIVAHVPGSDWASLDAREAAYVRHDVTKAISRTTPPSPTAVYQVDHSHGHADTTHPILRSYLDVVVQGYLQVFGEEGVTEFFATTAGWDAPVLDDRDAPRYSRHQPLSEAETALVDTHLAAVVK